MVKKLRASSEITIIDISDSRQLTQYIGSFLQRQVIYEPNSKKYLPDYSTTPNILTPQLYISGSSEDVSSKAKSMKWFVQKGSTGVPVPITGNTVDYELTGTMPISLKIKSNVLSTNLTMNYIVESVYTDENTGMDVLAKSQMEIIKITNGSTGSKGSNAIVGVLTNETHNVPSDSAGNNENYTGATSKMQIYDGITESTAQWTITATPSEGIVGTFLSGTYTVTKMSKDICFVDFIAKRTGYATIEKRFTITKTKKGDKGEAGKTPIKGTDYFDGEKGQDGKSSYLWVMYSQNPDGSSMSDSPLGAKYIGIATTATDNKPVNFDSYTWSLIKGTDGLKGETGANGESSYLHIKYSNDGLTFTANAGEDVGDYIGTYVDFTKADSTTFGDYVWNKVKGADGKDGRTPVKGSDYFDGVNGQDGKSSYLWIMYSQNIDGTGLVSSPLNAKYVGIATTSVDVKPTLKTSYTWSLIKGTDGVKGETGVNGKTSYLHIKYSDNGTSFTSNVGEDVGAWIGTYVDFIEKDSTIFADYSWNKVKGKDGIDGKTPIKGTDYFDGEKGQDGASSYLWIMYSQNPDGSGMVDVPSGAKYIGVATTKTNSKPLNFNSYTWSLIRGTDGVAGEKGADGETSYLHVKYSNNGTSFTANGGEDAGSWIGTYVDFIKADSTVFSKYTWSKIRGEDGVDGKTPIKGTDYFDGTNGQDGESSYLWVMYSQNANGLGMTVNPLNAKYIGIATTKTNSKPVAIEGYTWSLIKGTDGVKGETGINGETSYLHIKYSNNGTSFTASEGEVSGDYIGTYVDFIKTDSKVFGDYTWSKIKGEDGVDGKTPIKGSDYFDGIDGQDGESSYMWIMYSQNADGTGLVASPLNAKYIGVATTKVNNKPLLKTGYTWSLIKGTDGVKGETGLNGKSSYLHIKYSNDGKSFTANAGEDAGAYIGTYTDFTEADSTVFASYTWSKIRGEDGKTPIKGTDYFDGEKGQNGQSSYLWVMYSQNANGSGMITDSTNAKYIGVATTTVNTKPLAIGSYTWSLIKGTDGISGEKGADGKTSYLHVKYSNDGLSFTGTDGEEIGSWIGTYVDFTEEDSKIFTDYSWSKVRGENGTDGNDGNDATVYSLVNETGAVKRTEAGIYQPNAINVKSVSQTGLEKMKPSPAIFVISEQAKEAMTVDEYNGLMLSDKVEADKEYILSSSASPWVERYRSTYPENQTEFKLAGDNVRAYKIQMYSGDESALLDEQTIPVVFDGADPVLTIIEMLDGDTIKNSEGTLRLKANTYKGNSVITADKYEWFERDPSAVSTGGWRILNATNSDGTTGYTTDTLTVSGSTIDSISTFKVVITRDKKSYTDYATVHDQVDPIQTEVIGTTTFKNGVGQNSVTAILYQNGMEIDTTAPYKYVYTWSMYKANGTIDPMFKATGKKINVLATHFMSTANLVCVVSTP